MRFNKQELATLATQPSNKFEKEGILYVTERQDGFFRRTEGKNDLNFHLKLFYFLLYTKKKCIENHQNSIYVFDSNRKEESIRVKISFMNKNSYQPSHSENCLI